jgi:hypothetical protein
MGSYKFSFPSVKKIIEFIPISAIFFNQCLELGYDAMLPVRSGMLYLTLLSERKALDVKSDHVMEVSRIVILNYVFTSS